MNDTLYLVIPCYNEEEALPETARQLKEKMDEYIEAGTVSKDSKILFVNDGSKDGTWALIQSLCDQDPLFAGVCLSRNRGHQNALLAGLMTAKDHADVAISLDADLQDDIHAMDRMLMQYYAGHDVVYGVRSSRKKDTFFKRHSAQGFYRLMRALGVDVVYNHADYRLMSRRALEGLAEFDEVNLFLRGIVPLIGFPSTTVDYERGKRIAGESKYPFKKMLSFALDGITSFSVKPLKLITSLGILIFVVSLIMVIWALVAYFSGWTVSGWTSILASIWMIGGIQLLCLGVIGQYVGKIYGEAKHRPRYLISETIIHKRP